MKIVFALIFVCCIGCDANQHYARDILVESDGLCQERAFPIFGISDIVQVGFFANEGKTVGIVVDGPFCDPKGWHEWRYQVYLPRRGIYKCKQTQLKLIKRFDWETIEQKYTEFYHT